MCYHGSFSLYSCHRPECYEEMLLCCVLLFLHSDTIAAHTRPCGVCEGNYPGENSFWTRGFFVDIRHTLSSHGNHNLNQFPLVILH